MDKIRAKFFKSGNKEPKESPGAAAATANADEQNSSNNGLTLEYFQTQLLLDYLMHMKYTSADHEELIGMCLGQMNDDQREIRVLQEFKEAYLPDRALAWYLRECFLYKVLNYSLESEDLRNLFLFRRILRDIEQQMQQHRSSSPVHVYRSQLMPLELLDRWVSSVGQCVTVSSFLSATVNHEIALTFLNTAQVVNNNDVRVLLDINADPRIIGSKPFVQLGSLNYAEDKNEVLFMFGSIFLINDITCGKDGLYTIEMTLYNDADHEFKPVFDDLKKKYFHQEMGILGFAQVLSDFNRFDEAEEYVNHYLEQLPTDHDDTVRCYHMLGDIALAQNDYETSLMWFQQSLEMKSRKSRSAVDPSTADDHERIANIHAKKGNFDLAIEHYTAALEIKTASLPAQHPSIAMTFEHLAGVYEGKRDRSRAISCLEKASAVYRRTLSPNDDKLLQIDKRIRHLSQAV